MPCLDRHLDCQYETERGETTSQAARRRHEEANHQLAIHEQLFSIIQTEDERNVAEIVRWIRSGHSADAIVQRANAGGDFAGLDQDRHALNTLLVNLAHSTGSLRQVLRLALSVSTGLHGAEVPDPQRFRVLCNRIVHFSYVEDMLLQMPKRLSPVSRISLDQVGQPSSAELSHTSAIQDGHLLDGMDSPDVPPHRVPAAPWTTLTSDDEAVSHLISLFLAWINPGWRFVEADIFLKGIAKLCTESSLHY
jgi:hypothetical protein